jgi:hypothetical protein
VVQPVTWRAKTDRGHEAMTQEAPAWGDERAPTQVTPATPTVCTHTFVVPVWIVVFCLILALSPPTGIATGVLEFLGGALTAGVLTSVLRAGTPNLFRKDRCEHPIATLTGGETAVTNRTRTFTLRRRPDASTTARSGRASACRDRESSESSRCHAGFTRAGRRAGGSG